MTNRSRAFWASTALLTSLAMSSAVYAQETTSAVRGTVVSADGSPVAGSQVTLTHLPSGTTLSTVTDGTGTFTARGLRPGGPYLVEATSDAGNGTLEDISLQVAETTPLTLYVGAGSAVDDVVVVGIRDVTADNTGVTSVLDREGVQSVVSVNRDIRDLARRNILVSQNTRGDGGISIAGSNPRTNRITIDGTQAQDDFGLNTGGTPTRRGPVSLDAIEQFSVSAVPVDVENGDFSGGALDVVLRSGGNDFHGSAFVNYLNDGLVGTTIRSVDVPSAITQTNYGFFFSGPLWRDRLFFASSYELYETVDQTSTGPTGGGFANDINGITQADLDGFVNQFNTVYASDFEVGGITRTKPITDEKYTGKLDWNITDSQRLSLTYRHAESGLIQRTNLSRTSAGFDSQWYLTGEDDTAYAAELNSQWTDNFSTQLRVTFREYERLQQPPSGQEFSDITVCSDATRTVTSNAITGCGSNSVFRFGPDSNRHANFLATDNLQIQAKGEYALGDNLFKFGYQSQAVSVFNIFVPNSDGTYYFDSRADFAAGQASRLIYTNSITGNAEDAAADFEYTVHSVFGQDTLQLFDNLSVQAGARYDWYRSDTEVAFNQNFFNRNGFSNQQTYDGFSLLMPRASFKWEATDWLTVNGGLGLFSGGLPDVILSNSYSNTGVLTSGIQIERNPDGTFRETTGVAGFTQAIGAAALNINVADPRFGYDIPAAVQALQAGAVASPTSEVNALAPNFELPSDWKYFLTTTVELPEGWSNLGRFGDQALDNWRVSLDVVYTDVNKGLSFRDFRAQPLLVNGVQQFTPDGRIRYDGILGTTVQRNAFGITSTNPGSNRDIVAFNTTEGESYSVGVSAERSFFDGDLDVLVGYARSNIEDRVSGARFGSTASSLYGTGASRLDPNEEAFGTAFEEVSNRYKAEFNYTHDFFDGLQTRFNLFGEIRDGRPISFTMGDNAASRSPTFGVNRGSQLLYVPDFANDANPNDLNVGFVTFADAATRDRFRTLVDTFGLEYGKIVEKGEGSDDQPETYQIDLQFSQELPAFWLPGKFRFVADVQNLANLLNDEWGIVEEFGDTLNLINAQCADAAGVVQSGAGNPVCSTYRYSSASTTADIKNRDNAGKSFWAIQLGLRYEF
ncbi:TonB-dependent receptor [Brevundimonas subvibrioides]|uniref:OAR protein n=1 Tax=Brevundimonas subvibrioides (strain ATCC 15264 / DSM 4735 / LMG 14903 / NBRC 16000 / CB 81) TaxID=633149 RepID=D9QG24_BRESC|nr:TonB-dependent receptor [Brevundimonas subvibrioides]ADL02566.1 OAR protein precursor [Brevundimonas subvibrioides ATCC 15264]